MQLDATIEGGSSVVHFCEEGALGGLAGEHVNAPEDQIDPEVGRCR
jgi:hypothetical protein